MRYVCRAPTSGGLTDPEDLMYLFLYESFDSEYIFIISPWISSFRFSRKFIYYPYVSTYDVVEVLNAIRRNGTRIYILTRCFDDFLLPDFIYTAFTMYKSILRDKVDIHPTLINYLREQLEFTLKRLESSEKLVNLGLNVRSDLGINGGAHSRLHAKIYVNDRLALIGSANFTRSGIVRGGNWECLLMVGKGDKVYDEILEEAKRLYNSGKAFSECITRLLSLINDVLKPFGIVVKSLDDLKIKLKELYLML